ncbi:hypothetical protein QJS10_CPA09g01395 [Acorus calamus]|uniref:Reverse transcriptase n=1 Tax=Acorus calamus TaxID=4465 RepID=A0AAV9E4U0_ACOCL|nr:hypothetical protein QJS10_CPA09g01395 [Acorus calamus]
MYRLTKKLQHTKQVLKDWNMHTFGLAHERVVTERVNLHSAQLALQHDPLNPLFMETENKVRQQYEEALIQEEAMISQKALVTWLQEGDRCSKFFYAQFVARKSHNSLRKVVLPDETEILDQQQVQQHTAGRGLREILHTFAQQSGLELNKGKSQVFCGGHLEHHLQFVSDIGISMGQLPVTYFGLPLFTGALTPRLCLPLVDKLEKGYNIGMGIWYL